MQLAMPSSVGMWASAFVENILDEIPLLEAVYHLNDMNPLGSGLDMANRWKLIAFSQYVFSGFSRIQRNAMYCGNFVGEVEANVIGSYQLFGLILSRMASDLLLFTTKKFGFFTINPKIPQVQALCPKEEFGCYGISQRTCAYLLGYEQQVKGLITIYLQDTIKIIKKPNAALFKALKC